MKKLLLFLVMLFVVGKASAQSFETQYGDTSIAAYDYNVGGSGLKVYNKIRLMSGYSARPLEWRYIRHTFPTNWNPEGFCDNITCYPMSTVISSSSWFQTDTMRTTSYGDMHLSFLSVPGTGVATMTIEVRDPLVVGSNRMLTFIATKSPQGTINYNMREENIKVYPNPARESVNVVFDNDNIKTIGVFNLLGQPVSMFHVMGNSANLPLGDAPEGVYFLRMYDAQGKIVATRRFTRQ